METAISLDFLWQNTQYIFSMILDNIESASIRY